MLIHSAKALNISRNKGKPKNSHSPRTEVSAKQQFNNASRIKNLKDLRKYKAKSYYQNILQQKTYNSKERKHKEKYNGFDQ